MSDMKSVPSWYRRTIELGFIGPDVEIVRRKFGLDPRGSYDATVQELVRGLARKRKVDSDGQVTEAVAAELGESAAREAGLDPTWYTRPLQLWFEGEDVRGLRELLGVNPARGVRGENRYDTETEAAVRRHQSEHGLPLTGQVDSETARSLGEAPH